MEMVKALIFDLGNVIVRIDMKRMYAAIAAAGHHADGDLRARAMASGLFQQFETGQLQPEQFAERICRELGLDMNYTAFCDAWNCILLPEPLVPEDLLQHLHSRYRTLLLSNTNVLHFSLQQQTVRSLRHFDDYILSHEVGLMKPDPRIYQLAVARAGCRPEECFFTDDMQEFVAAARAEGIDAVQFRSVDQLIGELQARGIYEQ